MAPRPLHEIEHRLVLVPLPMVVCDAHKLPRRIEMKLMDSRRFRRLLARHVAAQGRDWLVLTGRAWVAHERLPEEGAQS